MQDTCLHIDELKLHLGGKLPVARAQHLAACPLCQAAAEGLELHPELERTLTTHPFYSSPRVAKHQQSKTAKPAFVRYLQVAMAAAAVGLLAIVAYRYEPAGIDQASIRGEFAFVEEPYLRVTRSANNAADYYANAAKAYEASKYAESVRLYEPLVDKAATEMLQTRGRYEYGMALWKLGEHARAADELTAARFGESSYYEDATWALAQLYRSLGDYSLAEQLYLDLTKKRFGPYAERARAALELLPEADARPVD